MFNENVWYDEKQTFRAVTGANANFPKSDGTITVASFPAKGTIPIARAVAAATISSTGVNVRADGALDFTTISLKVGDFLYNGDVLRQVKAILSPKLLELNQAFPSNLSGAALLICEKAFKAIYCKNTHSANAAILQEASFAAGETFLNGGAPISYDATAGTLSFTVHR